MLSYVIPALGEISDIIWAPISAFIMLRLYKGKKGKIAAIISFLEEIFPVDIIPVFTLMWIYTNFLEKKKIQET